MWRMFCLLLWSSGVALLCAQSDVRRFTVNPTALNFSSVDPDSGLASASSTLTWRIRFASGTRLWRLSVKSEAPNVTSCGKIALNSFRVSCTSLAIGKDGTGTCGAPIPLSGFPQVIASGSQGDHNYNSTAELQVQFLDSWQYPAAVSPSCSILLTYTIEAL